MSLYPTCKPGKGDDDSRFVCRLIQALVLGSLFLGLWLLQMYLLKLTGRVQ